MLGSPVPEEPDVLRWRWEFGVFLIGLGNGITGELIRLEGKEVPVGVGEWAHYYGRGWQLASERQCVDSPPGTEGALDLTSRVYHGTSRASNSEEAKKWAAEILGTDLGDENLRPTWSRRPQKGFAWRAGDGTRVSLSRGGDKRLAVGQSIYGTLPDAQWWFRCFGWRRADTREAAEGGPIRYVERWYGTKEKLPYAPAEGWARRAFESEELEITGEPDKLFVAAA